jgi:molecular chaperone Hsp33
VGKVEAGLLGLPSLGPWFASGKPGTDLLRVAFSDEGLAVLETIPAAFSCDCSRERFASFLKGASDELLIDLATEGPWPVVITCHNCGSAYEFPKAELEALAAERGAAKEEDRP